MDERQQKITELAQAIGIDVKEIFLNLRDPAVTPENGWVLQFRDGYFTPTMRKIFRSSSLEINQDSETYIIKIQEPVNFQRTGVYRFVPIFNWSIDSTTTDFEAQLFLNTDSLTSDVSEKILKKEGKDATGNAGDGRGTTQIDNFCGAYYAQINSIGNRNLELRFKGEGASVEASAWEVSILVEEIIE